MEDPSRIGGGLQGPVRLDVRCAGVAVAGSTSYRPERLEQRYVNVGKTAHVIELDVDEIGPSLRYATAKVIKATRDGTVTTGVDVLAARWR